MQRKVLIVLVALTVLVIYTPDLLAQGCSQCRLVPQSNVANGGKAGTSLNPAILYLMSVPYLILGAITFTFRKQIFDWYKKRKK